MLYSGTVRARASNFELWSWLFMRVSGVVLLVMILAHLAIMHVTQPITNVTFEFVSGRWANPLWRWFDLIMLSLALVHGMNGARIVSDDLFHSRGWRLTIVTVLYVVAFVALLVGAQIILSFQPGGLHP